VSGSDTLIAHRWRFAILLLATAVGVAGFKVAGQAESRYDGIGIVALPLFWGAAYLTTWRAIPFPALALCAGVALGARAESNDNEMAWLNYAAGLLLCEAAVAWGAANRRQARRKHARTFDSPERPT
jgi:hypothetical protein